MMFFPYNNLFIGSQHTIASLGPFIVVLDTLTGTVLASTYTSEAGNKIDDPVRCLDVNSEEKRLASVGDDKILKIWELARQDSEVGSTLHLRLMNTRELPKKATKVKFTKDGETVLVSDKFGDVFSYPLHYAPANPPPQPSNTPNSLSSHDSPSNGTLVLGHASPLNYFLLTDDESYIITADRDEHVRVSRFPKGYVIEMYCLGHLTFVSALHIPRADPLCLISGGGDPVLKVWDWISGRLRWEVRVWELVEPFVTVDVVGRKGGEGECESEGEDDAKTGSSQKKKGRKQAKKGKSKAKDKGKKDGASENPDEVGFSSGDTLQPPKVLVIQQIESLLTAHSGTYILFSAVGATALFAFPFKSDVQPSEVVHFELGKPILGFCVDWKGGGPGEDKLIVVYVDAQWQCVKGNEGKAESQPEGVKGKDQEAETEQEKRVRALKLSSGQFVEDLECRKELLESFNSKIFIPATPSELRSLDLYGPLTSLPKHSSDPEPSLSTLNEVHPTRIPIGAPELSASNYKARADVKAKGKMIRKSKGGGEDEQTEDGKTTNKGERGSRMSKKEIGRMKVKMKVLEREKALAEAQAEEREKLGVEVMDVEKEEQTKMSTEGKEKEDMVRKRGDDAEEEGVEMKRARVDNQEECMDQS